MEEAPPHKLLTLLSLPTFLFYELQSKKVEYFLLEWAGVDS